MDFSRRFLTTCWTQATHGTRWAKPRCSPAGVLEMWPLQLLPLVCKRDFPRGEWVPSRDAGPTTYACPQRWPQNLSQSFGHKDLGSDGHVHGPRGRWWAADCLAWWGKVSEGQVCPECMPVCTAHTMLRLGGGDFWMLSIMKNGDPSKPQAVWE